MTPGRPPILTDDLLRDALMREPATGTADALADDVLRLVVRTPQRRQLRIAWPWAPTLPGLPPSSTQQRLRAIALLVALALVVTLSIGIAALVGSFHRLPPPFGLAKPGLIAYDLDGTIVLAGPDGSRVRDLRPEGSRAAQPSFSFDGLRLAYWASKADTLRLVVIDPADPAAAPKVLAAVPASAYGNQEPQNDWPGIAWSPDSRSIAFSEVDHGRRAIFVAVVDTGLLRRVGDPSLEAWSPAWSPDGQLIAFIGGRYDAERGIYLMSSDGSNPRRLTHSVHGNYGGPAWSPRGDVIAFDTDEGTAGTGDIHLVDVATGAERSIPPVADAVLTRVGVSFSPDGSRLAYLGYPEAFPLSGSVVICNADGSDPTLITPRRADGSTLALSGLAWLPDARSLLVGVWNVEAGYPDQMMLLDVATHTLSPFTPVGRNGGGSWQRLAP